MAWEPEPRTGGSQEDLGAFNRRYVACYNAYEFHRLGGFVAVDVKVNGEAQSLGEYVQNLEAVTAAFPDYHWDLQHLLVDGDWLAAHFIDTGTHMGLFLGVPASGRQVSTHEFAIYRIAAGRIAEVWVTVENLGVLRRL